MSCPRIALAPPGFAAATSSRGTAGSHSPGVVSDGTHLTAYVLPPAGAAIPTMVLSLLMSSASVYPPVKPDSLRRTWITQPVPVADRVHALAPFPSAAELSSPTTTCDSFIAMAVPVPIVSGAAPGAQRITEPAEDPTITPDSVTSSAWPLPLWKRLDYPLARRAGESISPVAHCSYRRSPDRH